MLDKSYWTDEQIVEFVQRGDIKSFGIIVDRYEDKLLRYAKRFLSNREDAKDVLQEIFFKTYTNIQSFDASRRFSPWIYRVAHNEFINAIKKSKNKETVSLFDFDTLFPHFAASNDSEESMDYRDLKRILDTSLARLGSKYREPLILFYFEDLDYKEIAEILQIPVSTVGVRLRRGKEILKKLANQSNQQDG